MINAPRLCFPTKSRLTRAIVSTVRTQWSSWCSCGHLLKIALTTGPYTYGAAQEAAARGRAGGKYLIQNKRANANGGACGATASERGAVCVIMKNMLPNLSVSLLDVENISARPRRRLRPSLHIKMSTPFLCVASHDGGCCALIKHVDVHRRGQDAAFRPWV